MRVRGWPLLAATLLSACGQSPARPDPVLTLPVATPLPEFGGQPSMPGAPVQEAVSYWRGRVNQAHGAVRAYTAQMSYF